jgi:hypothetical protein
MTVIGFARADTPGEQLAQMVQQLQQTPGDNALREKIIKLSASVKPAPAVPEEARRSFIKGTTFVKAATDPSQQKLAVESFQEAVKIAPWWGDAYYNLAIAQDLAGLPQDAQASLKLYLLTSPGEKDAREAQDRIYALEAKQEALDRQKTDRLAAEQKKKAEFAQRLNGQWSYKDEMHDAYYQVQVGSNDTFTLTFLRNYWHGPGMTPGPGPRYEEACSGSIDGNQLKATCSRVDDRNPWGCGFARTSGSLTGSVSDSGDSMPLHFNYQGTAGCRTFSDPMSYDLKLLREK